jgi:large subunit ribosomal protein L4e
MKTVKVYDLDGKDAGKIELPEVFSTPLRPDVIKRAVLALQSASRQPYGTDPLAGKRTSAHYHGLRRYRFTMMNREMSRIPRIHGKGASGTWQAFTARFAPHAVKGRAAHPPKVEKIWLQKINKKEYKLALRSALAAAAQLQVVRNRGHRIDCDVPIVVVDEFENLDKTAKIFKVLNALGLKKEFDRCENKRIRAGKGKRRGRKYKKPVGPLIVLSKECPALKACKNLKGVDVALPDQLDVELLAPGTHPGRLMVVTQSALQCLNKI